MSADTIWERTLRAIAERRAAERAATLTPEDFIAQSADQFERGMVSEESSEPVASPHETPRSIPDGGRSVAEFYAEEAIDGRAVLIWKTNQEEPLLWIARCEEAFWLCHYTAAGIRELPDDMAVADVSHKFNTAGGGLFGVLF